MKYLIIILILFSGCKGSELIPELLPEYTLPDLETADVVIPSDSIQPIIINNYIMPEEKSDKVMTPETFRFLILEISSLLATIIAVIAVDNSNP